MKSVLFVPVQNFVGICVFLSVCVSLLLASGRRTWACRAKRGVGRPRRPVFRFPRIGRRRTAGRMGRKGLIDRRKGTWSARHPSSARSHASGGEERLDEPRFVSRTIG